MKSQIRVFFAVIFIAGASCSNVSAKKDFFPEKRPSDFTVIYNSHGGMLRISEKIYISADSSYFEKDRYGMKVRLNFNVSNGMLDDLYDVLKKNRFNEIEIFSEKVYDRGGNSVRVISNDSIILVNNSGIIFIDKDWVNEYSAITAAIMKISDNAWNEKARDFKIIVDKSLNDENGYVMFDEYKVFGEGTSSVKEGEDLIMVVKLVNGMYAMNFSYLNDYGNVEVPVKDHSGIRIFMSDGKLSFKMLK